MTNTDDNAMTTTCLECGKRFERGYRGQPQRGIRTAAGRERRRHTGGEYCCDAHRQIGYRRRKAIREGRPYHATSLKRRPRGVTLSRPPTTLQTSVTLAEIRKEIQGPAITKKRGLPRAWRWYERLDGSGDLYCDVEDVGSHHMGRIVRAGDGYRATKPVMAETWATRKAAENAVRNQVRRAA
jgi:hypothetical protein